MSSLPILYSFRRCPYAIRARFALKYAGQKCLLREVWLRQKPEHMLELSPKGTVPVLLLPSGQVIDESLDVIKWALEQNDPENYLSLSDAQKKLSQELIKNNDRDFVKVLHAYKYPDQHPEISFEKTKQNMQDYLNGLENLLSQNKFLLADHPKLADIALFPFVRQVLRIDEENFRKRSCKKVIAWLDYFLTHEAYEKAMEKFKVWDETLGEGFEF